MNSPYNMGVMQEHYGSDYDRTQSHSYVPTSYDQGQAIAAAYRNKTAANYFSVSHLLNLEALPRQDCAMYDASSMSAMAPLNNTSPHNNNNNIPLEPKRLSLSPPTSASCRRQDVSSACAVSPRHCVDSPASDSSEKNTSGKN